MGFKTIKTIRAWMSTWLSLIFKNEKTSGFHQLALSPQKRHIEFQAMKLFSG